MSRVKLIVLGVADELDRQARNKAAREANNLNRLQELLSEDLNRGSTLGGSRNQKRAAIKPQRRDEQIKDLWTRVSAFIASLRFKVRARNLRSLTKRCWMVLRMDTGFQGREGKGRARERKLDHGVALTSPRVQRMPPDRCFRKTGSE